MQNVQEALAQSDKIAEVILDDGRFVEIFPVRLKHMILSKDDDGLVTVAKLIHYCCLFDGKRESLENIVDLSATDVEKIVKFLTK